MIKTEYTFFMKKKLVCRFVSLLFLALFQILNIYAENGLELPFYVECEDHELEIYTGFTLCYRESYEQSEWVAYELTAEELSKEASRSNNFHSDKNISTGSATTEDYRSSGYDRGHLAPAADMAWNKDVMSDSFLMSNMSPQSPSFNRGVWSKLESKVREWAAKFGRIYVVTGPILEKESYPTIGANKVAVPEYYYKALLYVPEEELVENDFQMIGFILPNEGSTADLYSFVVSVDEIEARTGIDFFYGLDDEIEDKIESNKDYSFWQ